MNIPIVFAVTIGTAFAANLILIPLILVAAHRYHLFDRVDHRKAHTGQIPALGGIGIFLSFVTAGVIAMSLLHLKLSSVVVTWRTASIALGLVLIHGTGVVDDMVDIPAGRKLLLQIAAAVLVVIGGTMFTTLDLPVMGAAISLGTLAPVLTVLWIIGMANAMNLIDGIDGFSGGVALFAALTIGIIALDRGIFFTTIVAGALAGSVAGFLLFNFPPARIFMGDGGSLFLGFSLAVLAVLAHGTGVPIGVPIILLTIPILDILTAVLRRLRHRIPIHAPDANHFHHRLLRLAGSGRRAVAVAWTLNAIAAAGALAYARMGGIPGFVALIAAGTLVLVIFVSVFRLRPAVY